MSALSSNSSLAVRQRRYNEHIARAVALEAEARQLQAEAMAQHSAHSSRLKESENQIVPCDSTSLVSD